MHTYVPPKDSLDYDAQFAAVEQFYDEYLVVRAEAIASHGYAYNADFEGKIPGLAGPHESRGIFELQCLHAVKQQDLEMEQVRLDHDRVGVLLGGTHRADSVVLFTPRHYVGGTGLIRRYEDVRILVDVHGRPYALLPPRKRTHGFPVGGDRVEMYAKGLRRA